jgi:hypothetical protein
MEHETAVRGDSDLYVGLREVSSYLLGLVRHAAQRPEVWLRMRRIAGAQQGIFDTIAQFLRTLLDRIAPWNFFPYLEGQVFAPFKAWFSQYVFNPLVANFWSIYSAFVGWFNGQLGAIRSVISQAQSGLTSALTGAANILGYMISNPLQTLQSVAGFWLSGIQTVVGWIPESVRTSIREWWTNYVATIQGIWSQLSNLLKPYLSMMQVGMQQELALITNQGNARQKLWDSFEQTWAGKLLNSVTSSLTAFWQMILASIRAWWAKWRPIVIDAARDAIAWARPVVEQWVGAFQELPGKFLQFVAGVAGNNLALEPARALQTAGSLYAMSIAAGTTAMTLSTALNLIPTTNWVGMSQFSAFIAEAAGFEPITRATYGVLLNECLAYPLRYHWNMQLRPKIPTEGEIFIMGRKRGLTRAEFSQAMGMTGLPDWWIDKTYQFFWTDPSPMWLLRMSEVSRPEVEPSSLFLPWLEEWMPNWRNDPWAWYRMKILLAGFEDTDVPAFINAFQRRLVSSATTQYKTSIRAMVRAGFWGREQVREALTPIGGRQDEVELIIAAEEMDYLKEYLEDEVLYYQESYRKGQLSDQDLSLALSTIIVRPERVAQIVNRERVRVLTKPKAVAPAKEDPLVTKLRNQAVDSWIKRFRSWQISDQDLELGLTIVLEDRDRAGALVEVELTRYREPPKEPAPEPEDPVVAATRRSSIASWVDQFRKGQISADELELGLSPLIADRETVAQIRQLEELRARPAPEIIPPPEEDDYISDLRQEAVEGHLQMFRKRLIGLGQLYVYLVADGLGAELARSTTVTEGSKRIKVPNLDSPYFLQDKLQPLIQEGMTAYEELYLKGQITIDQFVAWLSGIGVDPDLVTYLADVASLKAFLKGMPA